MQREFNGWRMALEGTDKLLGEHRIEDVYRALDVHVPDVGPSKAAARNAAVAMVISEQGDGGRLILHTVRQVMLPDPFGNELSVVRAPEATAIHVAQDGVWKHIGPDEVGRVLGGSAVARSDDRGDLPATRIELIQSDPTF